MEGPIKGDKGEGAPAAGTEQPAAGAPPMRRDAVPGSGGGLAGGGAEEGDPANTKPGGTREEVKGRLSLAAPPPPAAGRQPRGREEGAKWSPGRRNIVRGPELWKLLKERLKDPNRPAFRSTWQDMELVWRVLRALVARLDLGRMSPLVARALDPWGMKLPRRDVSTYVGS